MARASLWVRFCAIAAVLASQGDTKAAIPIFEKYCPEHELREGQQAFIDRWWQRYLNRTDGECFLRDSHRKGRPAQLQDKHRKEAADAFASGFYSNGKRKAFESLEQVRRTWLPGSRPPRHATP